MSIVPVPNEDVPDTAAEAEVLQLHAETVTVDKRRVAGDTVRVSTRTRVHEQDVETVLVHERVEIERVAVGRVVDAAPPIRQEGDVTVISVVEEIVVVERRLVLKEEVRVRRVLVQDTHRETVLLRDQVVDVVRTPAAADGSAPADPPADPVAGRT